jgi:hypothetical protein
VCYKLVSEKETTLGLCGLMNELPKYLIREILGVTPYINPFIRGLFKPLLKEGMKISMVVCDVHKVVYH